MIMSGAMARIVSGAAAILLLLGGPLGPRPAEDPPHRTGLIPPTAEEMAELRATGPRISRIHLNRIGLGRVNAVRKAKGLSPLDPSAVRPIGRELELAVPGPGAEVSAQRYGGDIEMAASLPVAVDNSTLKYFPPIRDQGLLGSCVAFATTYTQLSYMNAIQRDLDISDPAADAGKLSPKWTYNMINDGSDLGAYLSPAYDLIEKSGAATWAEFPYDGDYRAWCLDPAVWRNALSVRTDPRIPVFDASRLVEIKQLLNNGYVFAFGTFVASWSIQAAQDDPTTADDGPAVGKPVGCWVNGAIGSHAMVAVGYNDAVWADINGNGLIDAGEKGALKIANSWGTSWGDGGFIWLAYDALRKTSSLPPVPLPGRQPAFFGDCAYVVTVRPDPPPLMIAEFTVSHAKRSQLWVRLARSGAYNMYPDDYWTPSTLQRDGGPYAFDGTTTAVAATFVLDFSDLLIAGAGVRRYYLLASDNVADNPATFSSFKIIDLTTDPPTEVHCPFVPLTIDNGETTDLYVDYDYPGPVRDGHPPQLSAAELEPSFGDPGRVYRYSVDYDDDDFDPPAVRSVFIDGEPHVMSHVNGSAYHGRYRYETALAAGPHEYYFLFTNGRGVTVRLPLDGTLGGPEVYPLLLASFSPAAVEIGDPAFVLSVLGSNFAEGAVIRWDGVDRPTTFVSGAEVTAPIGAEETTLGRVVQVTVRNPDGGISNALGFPIRFPAPDPIALSPARVCAGSGGFTMVLTGSRIFPGSLVRFEGVPRETTYVGPTELRTTVAAEEIAASGVIDVDVINPAPGGGASPAASVAVAGFTLETSAPITQTVNAGQSAAYTIGLASDVAPFDAPIALTSALLPKGCSVSFSPATVTMGSGTSGSSTLTIKTTARKGTVSGLTSPAGAAGPPGLGLMLFAALGLAALASAVAGAPGKAFRRTTVAALAMALVIAILSCSSGGGGDDQEDTGTPAGTYQIAVRGMAGSLAAWTNVELVVR
jgi:C1A family cysteine protease